MSDRLSATLLRTCVAPEGRFLFGVHQPNFAVANLRSREYLQPLGLTTDGTVCLNTANFPPGDVEEPSADWIYEIPNPFPFRGTTYIGRTWAERTAANLTRIAIPGRPPVSLTRALRDHTREGEADDLICHLPRPLRLALAATSTDPDDLIPLAHASCDFQSDPQTCRPLGLIYRTEPSGALRAVIHDEQLFDTVANNPHLPDLYKEVMVLRPGTQGQSEIVGECRRPGSHVFEYLRRNSYIPWGHYAANMADDAVRYAAGALTPDDVAAMRHLYYQRTYERTARLLHMPLSVRRRELGVEELEELRHRILAALSQDPSRPLAFNATLWGWNYGFDYAPNGYRLHASHQQIHQQYALVPATVTSPDGRLLPAYACGDQIQEFIQRYQRAHGRPFFDCYHQAIAANRRMDGRADRPASLVVHQDEHVVLFAPKAQTSQWELQLMTIGPVGNILEADTAVRTSLNQSLLLAMRALTGLGATMITVIEFSKRFDIADRDQRLLYSFLPRLPESPGAFSEAQLRWINGHYPEDFAAACRLKLAQWSD
jgi:hypothetical protein